MLQDKFNKIFDKIYDKAIHKKIALSVSGGSDSIALLHLAYNWGKNHEVEFVVFTVNHQLRPEAIDEVKFVEDISKKLNFKCFTLIWEHKYSHNNINNLNPPDLFEHNDATKDDAARNDAAKNDTDRDDEAKDDLFSAAKLTNNHIETIYEEKKPALQEKARKARYDLITNKALELGASLILTAHHFDDVIETYLMRNAKKASIFGLSYNMSYFHNEVEIKRPLINFQKKDLINYLKDREIEWLEDKSNELDIYERNRFRKQIAKLTDEEKNILVEKIKLNNKQYESQNEQLIKFIAENIKIYQQGFALISLHNYLNQTEAIQILALNYIITIVRGGNEIVRYRNLQKIMDKLRLNQAFKVTLNGVVVKSNSIYIILYREKALVNNELKKNKENYIWDDRFLLNFDCDKFIISNLNFEEYRELKNKLDLNFLKKISHNNHFDILFTLPVIKTLEKILAIPHINYYDDRDLIDKLNIYFRPNFISRFTHFF